MESMQLQDVV